jgi:hypothetical protein
MRYDIREVSFLRNGIGVLTVFDLSRSGYYVIALFGSTTNESSMQGINTDGGARQTQPCSQRR